MLRQATATAAAFWRSENVYKSSEQGVPGHTRRCIRPLTAPRRSAVDWRRRERHPGASAGRAARARGRPCRRDRRAAPAERVGCGSSPPRRAARAPPKTLPTAEHPHPGQGLHLPGTKGQSGIIRVSFGTEVQSGIIRVSFGTEVPRRSSTTSMPIHPIRRHQRQSDVLKGRTEEILNHVDAHPLAPTRRALNCASMLDGREPRP